MANKPTVPSGVAVFLIRNGKLLLMKRKGSHGAGTWSLPGGSIDPGEDSDSTAKREVKEETGMEVSEVVRLGWNDYFDEHEGKKIQWITLIYAATDFTGEPSIIEPSKCDEIGWFGRDELPSPLFESLKDYIDIYGLPRLDYGVAL